MRVKFKLLTPYDEEMKNKRKSAENHKIRKYAAINCGNFQTENKPLIKLETWIPDVALKF